MAPEDIKYYGKLKKKDEARVHKECDDECENGKETYGYLYFTTGAEQHEACDYLEKKYGYQCSYCSDSECGEGVEFYK